MLPAEWNIAEVRIGFCKLFAESTRFICSTTSLHRGVRVVMRGRSSARNNIIHQNYVLIIIIMHHLWQYIPKATSSCKICKNPGLQIYDLWSIQNQISCEFSQLPSNLYMGRQSRLHLPSTSEHFMWEYDKWKTWHNLKHFFSSNSEVTSFAVEVRIIFESN